MTPGTRRLLAASLFAVLVAAPIAALTPDAQAPTWPARADRDGQEGDTVTLLVRATNHTAGVTQYSSTTLPPGLSINASTGLITGILQPSTVDTFDGAAGTHQVTINATNGGGSSSYNFTWRVSRFRKGDVFAGIGRDPGPNGVLEPFYAPEDDGPARYRVFDENGNLKFSSIVTDRPSDFQDPTGYYPGGGYTWAGGTTTGCGYNWVTRKMYFTAFDDDYDPSVSEIDPVPATTDPATAFPYNRIRTFRDSGLDKGELPSGRTVDGGPESVVFGSQMGPGPDGVRGTSDDVIVPGQFVMYVGHAAGYYRNFPGRFDDFDMNADRDERPIIEPNGDWTTFYYLDADGNRLKDAAGVDITYPKGYSAEGYLEWFPGTDGLVLGPGNLPVTALKQWGRDIQKWVVDTSTGAWSREKPDPNQPAQGFDTHTAWQGSDWIDLASDQRTIYYSSEWGSINRYDVGKVGGEQLSPYAILPSPNGIPDVTYALRLLPPGDGSGGLLVATPFSVKRINAAGVVVNVYDTDDDGWFALNISPDGRYVWSASTSTGRIYKWNIASAELQAFSGRNASNQVIGRAGIESGAKPDPNTGRYGLDGLCIMGEYTAAQEICGNNIDDDADGEIDEVCTPIEACSISSPGDDDGDGLVDSNDPDCPNTTNVCSTTGFTDSSIAGYCARENFEGDTAALLPAPGPPSQYNQIETYQVSGLPPGVSVDANGVITGVPDYDINQNTDTEPKSTTYVISYHVERHDRTSGALVASFDQDFSWTIKNKNRPPVATSHSRTTRPGVPVTLDLLAADTADSDPDAEDVITLTGTTNPAHGLLTNSGTSYTYTPANGYVGVDSFTYTISDGWGGTATATVTIDVVNRPPTVVADAISMRPGQTASIDVLANDSDLDGDVLSISADTALTPQQGTKSRSGGTYTYVAAPAFTGVVTFTYTAADGYGGSATGTVTITIVNQAPNAVDDAIALRPGQSVPINVVVNDTDPDNNPDVPPAGNDPQIVTALTQPAHGTITLSGTTFTYTAGPTFVGTDSFQYSLADSFGGTDTAVVTIVSTNQPPTAIDDLYSTIAGTPLPAFNVQSNDPADPDSDTVTIQSFTQPSSGTVTRNSNGTFTYAAPNGFSGTVTFTYTVTDGFGGTDVGTVTIHVVNQPPVARDDSATTAGTQPVSIAVLLNDSDPDNHAISVTGATTPTNGSAVVNANGTITYTANAGFQGTDTFFYTIRDAFGGTSTATVTITVGPPNRFDPCVCATAKASPALIWPPNHKQTQVVNVTNLVDPDGGPLTIKILGIYQDEPTNYLGDGDTTIDAGGVGTDTAWVRAERTGNPNVPGNGRVYEIVFEATAQDGSTCKGSIFTGVPHDQGQGNYVIDDGIRYDSTVAGGPIVRNALKIAGGLSDADIAAREFTPRFVAQASIGGGGTARELFLGPVSDLDAATGDFAWTSGQNVIFLLTRTGSTVRFSLATSTQSEQITRTIECPNGECSDIVIRAEGGGTGRISLSSLNINGLGVPDTLSIAGADDPTSIHLSGLSLDEGVLVGGVVKIEWTGTRPAGATVNLKIQVGTACPTADGNGGGGQGTPPLARTDVHATEEDVPLIVPAATGVLDNDLTFAGALSASLVDSPANGTVSLAGNGSFTYTPNAGFNGQDTFRYRVNDGSLYSEAALVTITVAPVIDPPAAVDDTASTDERVPVTIGVLANDSDAGGGSVALASVTQPSNGTAVISGGSVIYTPRAGFIGVDTFTYTANGAEGTASAKVVVTVIDVNEAPRAVNDSYTTQEDTALTIAASGILQNDSDADADDTLTAVLVAGPSNGTVTVNANGSFTYRPSANYNGADAFTYRVRDAAGLESSVATVSLTITVVNDPPAAVNDAYAVAEDSALQINAPGVKSNDSDPDTAASGLTVTLVTGVQRGTLTLNADGSFLYTPLPNTSGSDSFVYRVSDGTASATATATIAITEVNDPPSAADDTASTNEDVAVSINVLGNDSDPDTAALTLQSVTQGTNGTVTIVSGQARYAPAANFSGSDTFTYTISDGTATATAKVLVTITPVNDAPTAVADVYTTPRNTPLNVQTPGVLGNDTDLDQGQNLTAVVVTQPSSGTLTMQGQGAFAYTPANNFTGTVTFTYRTSDGTALSTPVTVTITVTSSNQPPAVVNDSYTTGMNQALTISAPGIVGNDSDPDEGDTITASLVSTVASNTGTLTLNPNGSFTYTPANNYTGTTTFRYRARDNNNAQSNTEAIVSIEVSSKASSGQVCYDGGAGRTEYRAHLDWNVLENGDVRVRATVSRNYADNTYGINKIGWGNRRRDFDALYRSDFGQLAFHDVSGAKRLDFRIDYLSPLSGTPSNYGSRGIANGVNADGGMVTGAASDIVAMSTSMDLNMNAFGYVSGTASHPLKTYSPPTNASYATNALYPLWIWDVWYEATVKGSAFGSQGFGYPRLTGLHASPSKVDIATWRLVNCQ